MCSLPIFVHWALLTRSLVFRKQHTFDIDSHRKLGQHFGPLHKHATYAVPKRGDLDDVVGESSRFPAHHHKTTPADFR